MTVLNGLKRFIVDNFTATCLNVNCSTNENCVDLENGGQCQCNDGYEKDEADICQSLLF